MWGSRDHIFKTYPHRDRKVVQVLRIHCLKVKREDGIFFKSKSWRDPTSCFPVSDIPSSIPGLRSAYCLEKHTSARSRGDGAYAREGKMGQEEGERMVNRVCALTHKHTHTLKRTLLISGLSAWVFWRQWFGYGEAGKLFVILLWLTIHFLFLFPSKLSHNLSQVTVTILTSSFSIIFSGGMCKDSFWISFILLNHICIKSHYTKISVQHNYTKPFFVLSITFKKPTVCCTKRFEKVF